MKISKQARRAAKELFRHTTKDGTLSEEAALAVVRKVIELKPRGYLGILSHFKRLVQLDLERRMATVESAAPPSPELEAGFRAALTRAYGPGLNIAFAHNPALLGGVRVKVGSDVYDGSVQGRLTALLEQF